MYVRCFLHHEDILYGEEEVRGPDMINSFQIVIFFEKILPRHVLGPVLLGQNPQLKRTTPKFFLLDLHV